MSTDSAPPVDIEHLHDHAHEVTPWDLPSLLDWLTFDTQRAALVEDTLAELGIPEADQDTHGQDIPGSVLRKILYWTHVGWAVEMLTPAPAEAF